MNIKSGGRIRRTNLRREEAEVVTVIIIRLQRWVFIVIKIHQFLESTINIFGNFP